MIRGDRSEARPIAAFVFAFVLAAGVIAAYFASREFWSSRSVMYFPDEWMRRFPTWYAELHEAAVCLTTLVAALFGGAILGLTFRGQIWPACGLAYFLFVLCYAYLLLVSIWGWVDPVRLFWIPQAVILTGMVGGVPLGRRARRA